MCVKVTHNALQLCKRQYDDWSSFSFDCVCLFILDSTENKKMFSSVPRVSRLTPSSAGWAAASRQSYVSVRRRRR